MIVVRKNNCKKINFKLNNLTIFDSVLNKFGALCNGCGIGPFGAFCGEQCRKKNRKCFIITIKTWFNLFRMHKNWMLVWIE